MLVPLFAIVCTLLVACSDKGSDARMIVPGESNSFRVKMHFTKLGKSYSLGNYPLCLTKHGTATIKNVSPYGGNGKLRLVRFATRPDPASTGGERLGSREATLTQVGFPISPEVKVSTICPTKSEEASPDVYQHYTELGVEYEKKVTQTESSDGIRITYVIDGHEETFDVPFGATLCAVGGTPKKKKDCDKLA